MEYWNELILEKSWKALQDLKGKFDFILIGGWATYLWAKTQKSVDIDIVIDFKALDKIKQSYNLSKNDSLKKYQIKIEGIDIDLYVPHYSKLILPLEKLKTTKIEGIKVPIKEQMLILKQGAEIERANSPKGEKDRIDILSLLFFCEIDYQLYNNFVMEIKMPELIARLKHIITNFKDYEYFNYTPRQFKIKKNEILDKLKKSATAF